MDSGDSGSMQSSTERDDPEFDSSRGESVSSFFNNQNLGSISAPLHPPFPPQQNPNFFDPNLEHGGDLVWPGGSRSPPPGPVPAPSSFPYFENFIPPPSSSAAAALQQNRPTSEAQPSRPQLQIKNPKKRNRASRRAPTTVLTTDVNNFRQMVQEFTGIPSSPFSGSPYSRRLDLFSAASSFRGGALEPLFPHRPPLHKVVPQFPIASSATRSLLNTAMIDAVVQHSSTSIRSCDGFRKLERFFESRKRGDEEQ